MVKCRIGEPFRGLHRRAVASGRFRTLVLVLGYCGWQFGEAAAPWVGDVNLKARRIQLRRSVTNVTGKRLVEGPTKNHGTRPVPVPTFLAPLPETQGGQRPQTDLLFPSRRGGYLTVVRFGGCLTRPPRLSASAG